MTVLLLLLMTYERIGGAVHEWLGISIFVLFVLHHILNIKWTRALFKGRYSAFKSIADSAYGAYFCGNARLNDKRNNAFPSCAGIS